MNHFQELLVILSLIIVTCHGALSIKIMMNSRKIAPRRITEPGGIAVAMPPT